MSTTRRPVARRRGAAGRPVLEQELAYGEAASSNLVGFLAMPADAAEPLPGLIVIHEWWGLNDNIKAMTRRLAGEGYVALAVDLYGGADGARRPTPRRSSWPRSWPSPMRRGESATGVRVPREVRVRAAHRQHRLVPRWRLVAADRAACFPMQLDAMVMYYGQVVTRSKQLEPLRDAALGPVRRARREHSRRDVQEFRATLNGLGKSAEILIYSGADHAFANPSGGNYNAQAARGVGGDAEFLDGTEGRRARTDRRRERRAATPAAQKNRGPGANIHVLRCEDHVLVRSRKPGPPRTAVRLGERPPRGEKWCPLVSVRLAARRRSLLASSIFGVSCALQVLVDRHRGAARCKRDVSAPCPPEQLAVRSRSDGHRVTVNHDRFGGRCLLTEQAHRQPTDGSNAARSFLPYSYPVLSITPITNRDSSSESLVAPIYAPPCQIQLLYKTMSYSDSRPNVNP